MKNEAKITEKQLATFLLIWAFVFGILFHIYVISKVDFPIGDGGMFYVMVQDLQKANFHLPQFTSYNSGDIPFVYPPLPFYIYAFINKYFKIELLALFKWTPTIIVILSIFCFFQLSYKILKSYLLASFATIGFSLHPTFYGWVIMGGGITRSLGLLFSLSTLFSYYELITKKKWYYILLSAILGALLILSHPEWALQTFGLIFIFWVFNKPNGKLYLMVIITIILTFFITSPWWFLLLKYHGIKPFINAYNSGFRNFINFLPVLMLTFSENIYFPIFSILAIFGLLYEIIKRSYILPFSLVFPFVLDPRIAPQIVIIPASMLFSIGAFYIILLLPIWIREQRFFEYKINDNEIINRIWNNNLSKFLLGYILIYLILAGFAKTIIASNNYLPIIYRESFQWINNNIPPKSKFLVIDGTFGFEGRVREWFPALSNAISINTPQGTEWLDNFNYRFSLSLLIHDCEINDISCLDQLIEKQKNDIDYIYLINTSNLETGEHDPCFSIKIWNYLINKPKQYQIVYNQNSIYIFKVIH